MAEARLLWFDTASGNVSERSVDELPAFAADPSGWLWLDVPEPDAAVGAWLRDVFGLPLQAIESVLERNHVPRLYPVGGDVIFVVLHRPDPGAQGHIHYLELDQFVGPHYLITTHGPRSPKVELSHLLVETDAVAERVLTGRLAVTSPAELAHRIVSRLIRSEEAFVNDLARQVGLLEQKVMAHEGDHDPQAFLEDLFQARHALLTVQTMAMQSAEIYGRGVRLAARSTGNMRKVIRDLQDQYDRIGRIAHSQLAFLGGVTEYYRARTDTRMTIAAERLAVIAAVTLPVTAISSVLGMNVIVQDEMKWPWLIALLAVMSVLSLVLLTWAKRRGWW